jgi:serine/threonine protein kinase
MEASNAYRTDKLNGQQLRNYQIEERIGTGGMGRIFRARHLTLNRPVAIKVMHPHLAENPALVARFEREARTVSQLSHPNIVSMYDFDEHECQPYLVMELVEGGTLRDYLSPASPQLGLALSLELVRQAAAALDYAHQRGVIHRDIKPENLFLTIDPLSDAIVLKIGDFGLAHTADMGTLTQAGTMMGTISYMAPEQATGQPIDGRADVYALGIILYEICAGALPFSPTTPAEAIYCHVFREPPALSSACPDLPAELAAIVERCLAKDPAARFQTAAALADALAALLTTMPVAAPVCLVRQPSPELVSTLFAGVELLDEVESVLCDAPASSNVKVFIEPVQVVIAQRTPRQPVDHKNGGGPANMIGCDVRDRLSDRVVMLPAQPFGAAANVSKAGGAGIPGARMRLDGTGLGFGQAQNIWPKRSAGSHQEAFTRASPAQLAQAVAHTKPQHGYCS